MYFRYSSKVVAPIERSSPLANAGFKRFEASVEPSLAPAPTKVWSSSMNKMIWPSDFWISLIKALRRSSNSPRNFAPATRLPKSKAKRRLFFKLSGTSPLAILRARPSTIAVFPTPGSPIITGLFFVLRHNTCITRRISSSRPITGSILSWRAKAVKSLQYFSKERVLLSGSWLSTVWFPRTDLIACKIFWWLIPNDFSKSATLPSDFAIESKRCSVERNSSCKENISFSAFAKTFCISEEK